MKKLSLIVLALVLAGCGSGGYYSSSRSGLGEAADMQRWIVESPHYQAGGNSYVDYTK